MLIIAVWLFGGGTIKPTILTWILQSKIKLQKFIITRQPLMMTLQILLKAQIKKY